MTWPLLTQEKVKKIKYTYIYLYIYVGLQSNQDMIEKQAPDLTINTTI